MTLALAWRSSGRIHLASDSRIKLGEGKFADIGIKVIAIPVVVTDTGGPNGEPASVIFRQTYGLTYAGSLVNAGTFCELIAELLQNVQFIHRNIPFEFRTICDFLEVYSSRVSTEICTFMERNGQYEFFIAGYCPAEKRSRCAKFEFTYQAGKALATYEEVLKDEGSSLAIGTGAEAARKRVKSVDTESMLLALNDVIDSGSVPSVGGDIQYGNFANSENFLVQGIVRKSIEQVEHEGRTYGPTVQTLYKYRGFQLYENWNPYDLPLWTTVGFIELNVPSNSASDAFFRRSLKLPEA